MRHVQKEAETSRPYTLAAQHHADVRHHTTATGTGRDATGSDPPSGGRARTGACRPGAARPKTEGGRRFLLTRDATCFTALKDAFACFRGLFDLALAGVSRGHGGPGGGRTGRCSNRVAKAPPRRFSLPAHVRNFEGKGLTMGDNFRERTHKGLVTGLGWSGAAPMRWRVRYWAFAFGLPFAWSWLPAAGLRKV